MRHALPFVLSLSFGFVAIGCHVGPRVSGSADAGLGASKGLAASGNDPKVVALAKSALYCPRGSGDALFEYGCTAYQAWRDEQTFKDGIADATLVNLIEDPDERVRYLGASVLSHGKTYMYDHDLSARVVAAAAAETSPEIFQPMGSAVGHIRVERTHLLDPIVAIVKPHDRIPLASAILSDLLFNNHQDRPTYDFTMSMTKDPDSTLRAEAVGAFWVGGSNWRAETCKMWESHLEDPDQGIASKSAENLAWYDGCGSSYDALVSSLDRRVKEGRVGRESNFAYAPGRMCKNDAVRPQQKQAGLKLSKAMASDRSANDSVRSAALRSVVDCDPNGGKGFVARFRNDSEQYVRETAKELLTRTS